MKYRDVARFEFRVFATNLTPVKRKLEALATGEEQPASRETYIVTRLNIESNVKIRDEHLQVKGLKARYQMLEQWEPLFSKKLPVSTKDVENFVFPPLGLDVDLGDETELAEEALLALVAGEHALATVEVAKRRTLFDLGGSEAEFCELEIDEERLQTVAIEAVESEAAKRAIGVLGLEATQNESYASFLQRRLF
jgi:hypothetical protein